MKLIEELKRRNVFRVGAAYVLLGWLVIQVTDTVSPALNLPDWTLGLVTWLGIIGFPFALFFAWAFELTPDGIRRETDAADPNPAKSAATQKLDVALVLLLIIAIGLIAWSFLGDEAGIDTASDKSSAAVSESMAIAVLPLTNMSADSDNAYFAGGVHEEILTNLSHIEGLRVVSRTTALRYIDSDLSARDIGIDLGVRYIVEGSVRRVDNHVRITVQLIDAPSDAHLWASNYDRELTDVFAVQSEVAKAITNSLHLEIQPETIGLLDDMPTRSVKAYDLYTKALSISRSEPESEVSFLQQRELLEGAVAADPGFVEAWAGLNEILDHISRNILQNNWFGETETERDAYFVEAQQAAHRALEKAVTLDPDNVATLLAQASDYVREQADREFQTSRKDFIDRALELQPDNADTWLVLAWWYRLEGNFEAATPAFNRALELDPLNARIVASSLVHFRLRGDQEKTTELYERLTQIAPEKADEAALGQIHPVAKIFNLGAVFAQSADESIIDALEEQIEQMERAGPDEENLDPRIWVYRLNQFWSWLYQMRGDQNGILQQSPTVPTEDATDEQLFLYLWSEADWIRFRLLDDAHEEIAAAAETMLEANSRLLREDSQLGELGYLPMGIAYAATGNEVEVERLRRKFADMSDGALFSRITGPFFSYLMIDPEAAAKRALQRKKSEPAWSGTDWVAILHVFTRPLLLQPDMQAFFVEEDKWIDYLAARVPEYAKYRQ